tara:strand:+ start:123 stop:326 length:204 start_codon:yes stop_codon:yes gene_type:complete
MISPEEVKQHVDELRDRVNYAIWKQIHCMINDAGFTNPKIVEKMILDDIKTYIDSYAEKQVLEEDLK